MNEEESKGTGASGETAVLPETAAQLVELERLQQALAEAEERGRSHWEQYLRAVAELDNVRKRAQRDIEAAQPLWTRELAARAAAGRDSLELAVQNAGHADAREPAGRAGGDAAAASTRPSTSSVSSGSSPRASASTRRATRPS